MKKNTIMKRNPFYLLLVSGIFIFTAITNAQENNYIVSKYDFIPGEKVIFFDDFTSESIGDFPAQWLTNGSGEIVTSQKFPGRWFNLTKMGYYIPEAKEDFSENFTIEFDFVPMTTDNGDALYSFTFYLLTGSLTEPGGGGEPGDAGFQVYFDGENFGWKNWSMATEQRFNGNVTFPFKTNQKYHVAIWVQKQRVRIYANENKVLDVPRAVPTGSKPNIFRFDSRDEAIPLIGNFRIASGLPDMRNKLLSDGKIISYGIQFDVNSDKLKPESYSTLKVISDILKENPAIRIEIVGHTDSDGDDASNLDLSKRRAISVKNELVSKFGVEAAKLETDGKGESEPLTDNNSAVNKAKNRRVEFINLKSAAGAITTSTSSKAPSSASLTQKAAIDEKSMLDKYLLSRFVVHKKKIDSEDVGKVFSGVFQEVQAGFGDDEGTSYCRDRIVNIKDSKIVFVKKYGENILLFLRDDFLLSSEEEALSFNYALHELVATRSGMMNPEFLKKENKWYFIRDEYSESKGGFVVTVDQKSKIVSMDYEGDIPTKN
jgi:OOP family OmpA-OmpF porin